MSSSRKISDSSQLLSGLPANSPLQGCPHCEALLDITELEPLSRIPCPGCSKEISVRSRIGNFRLIEVAGKGGMGVVYRGIDSGLDRPVALKLLRRDHSSNESLIAQLETEAAITAAINHPHVIKVYSTGVDHGRFYIAMELADKGSLDNLMRIQGRVAEAQVLEIAIQIAQGLRAAHQHGLIHRDVKPGNILFSDARTAKIVDFGLAIFMEQEESVRGEIWGTPYYVAPEKLDYQPEDFRSDIYSLGATLFHALAGRPPFEAETASMVALKHLKSQALSLQAFAPWVSGSTAYVINRTLLKDPNDRYQSYDELIEHFEYAKEELQKKAANPEAAPTRVVLESADTQKAMSWITFAMIGLILAIGLGGFLFRDVLFKQRTSSPSAETATGTNSPFTQAIKKLSSGDGVSATQAFQRIADTRPGQPDLNWVTIGEGLAELVSGRYDESQAVFQRLVDRGIYSSEAKDAALAAFFFDIGRRMCSEDAIDPVLGKNLLESNHEAMGLLLFAVKSWEMGKITESVDFFRQFRATNPEGQYAWIGELKPLASRYMEEFAKLQMVVDQYKVAKTDRDKRAAMDQLNKFPSALSVYGETLIEGFTADPADANPPPAGVAGSGPIQDGTYFIVNRSSGKALSITKASKGNRSGASLETKKNANHQKWRVELRTKGQYRLIALHSNRCLRNADKEEGTQVIQYNITDNTSSRWLIKPSGNFYRITSVGSGKSLSLENSSTAEGTKIIQSLDSARGQEQEWEFIQANGTIPAPAHAPKKTEPAPKPQVHQAIVSPARGLNPNFQPAPQITANPSSLKPWIAKDIGEVPTPGASAKDNGVFTIQSRSSDIWAKTDSFHFVYQPIAGDFEFVARIVAVDMPSDYTKAGLMFRVDDHPGAVNATLLTRPIRGTRQQRRTIAGADTLDIGGAEPHQMPRWFKLVRRGTTITGFHSVDGQSWNQLAADEFPDLPKNGLIGLALTSHALEQMCTAKFDNVQIIQPPRP